MTFALSNIDIIKKGYGLWSSLILSTWIPPCGLIHCGYQPSRWGVRGRRGLRPSPPDVRAHPSEGCSPPHGWADTNFPRVSNTTSRHPFDTLVTGVGWSCAAELKKAERNEFFTQTALVRVKSDKERPAGVTFKLYGANIGSVFYTSVKPINLTETDIFQILDVRIAHNTNTMSLYNTST